mmetsp:Transcript_21933/g.52694  ORF Transcript_21933/g.52694 Transcript_21933/m.52694 type:complete len:366 (+) Transcript_21933:1093-2190(+)
MYGRYLVMAPMAREPRAWDAAALVSSVPDANAWMRTASRANAERSNDLPISPRQCSSSSFTCSGVDGAPSSAMKRSTVAVHSACCAGPQMLETHCAIDESAWRERGVGEGARETMASSASRRALKEQRATPVVTMVAKSFLRDSRAAPWRSDDCRMSSARGRTYVCIRDVATCGECWTMHTQRSSARCVRCSSVSDTSPASSLTTLSCSSGPMLDEYDAISAARVVSAACLSARSFFRRNAAHSITASAHTGATSTLRGLFAIVVRALREVMRVVSFLSRSSSTGRHALRLAAPMMSPSELTISPIVLMAASLTSRSWSCDERRPKVAWYMASTSLLFVTRRRVPSGSTEVVMRAQTRRETAEIL